MRNSLGVTGKKDPLKQSDELIKVKVSLHQAAPHNLDITVIGQSFGEYLYMKSEQKKTWLIYSSTRDTKLDELAYNYRQSRKRK